MDTNDIKSVTMAKLKISERVDFTYFIGTGVSSLFIIMTMYFYNGAGLPMAFSLVCFCTYAGVIIRGLIEKNSWGKTGEKRKISSLVGFISIFVIFYIDILLLLIKSFELPKDKIQDIIIYGGVGLLVIFILLYLIWFRKLKFDN